MKNFKKILISPSIIATDLTILGNSLSEFDKDIIDLLHVDVMDGNFVPNLTIGPGYTRYLKQHTEIPLDIHLMIEKPENTISSYIDCEPWAITIHYESTRFPARLLNTIKDKKILPGLAVNPATPIEAIFDLLPYCSMVLVMSVDPGFYGQKFMPGALSRIERLANFMKREKLENTYIQVDGGIDSSNIASLAHAGANIFVVGNAAFKGGDIHKNVMELKKSAQQK